MDDLSRREFVFAAAGALLAAERVRGLQAAITAQQIVDRIHANVGIPWRDKTVDGIKAGDPATAVTGVTTTAMATLDMLRKSAAAGRNFIVTTEPTFYTPADEPGNRADDPIYVAKKTLVADRRLVVFRLSDHWNARQPNEPARALAAELGWTASGTDDIYTVPDTTLGALITHIRNRLGIRGGIRTVGSAETRVRTVFVSPGTTDVPSVLARVARADLILAGEPREWEVVPYVLDARSAGQQKGLIALGRVVSEEPGMRACAGWIRSFVKEVPVESLAVGDPYWSPVS
jgi:hypothetical protein